MIKTTLNKEQAERLFNESAVLIGEKDRVTLECAEKHFGTLAIRYTVGCLGTGEHYNQFWCRGSKGITYLSKRAFMVAAGYHNAELMIAHRDIEGIGKQQ